jgi:hypothetical protein
MTTIRRAVRQRRGIATLEFALSLPVLLFLLAAILSTGLLGLGRVHVAIDAREAAWKERQQQRTSQPLFFSPNEEPLVVPRTREVRVFPPYFAGKTVTAHSKLAVLGGSWDYREVDPGGQLVPTIAKMSASAGEGQAQDLGSILSALGNFGSLGSVSDTITNTVNQVSNAIAAAKATATANVKQEHDKIKAQLQQAQGQLTALQNKEKQVDQQIQQLQDALTKAMAIKDQKQREQKVNNINQQLTAAQNNRNQDAKAITKAQQNVQALMEAYNQAFNAYPP